MPDRLDDFVCEISSDELIPDWWDEDDFYCGFTDDEDDYQ